MSITPFKQTSVYRQVDAILKTEDIYCGRQVDLNLNQSRQVTFYHVGIVFFSIENNPQNVVILFTSYQYLDHICGLLFSVTV